MLKKRVTKAECDCALDVWVEGSVLKNTIKAGVKQFRTDLRIDSPESQEDIIRIIRLAKRGCFTEQLVQNPVPLVSTYTVNGKQTDVSLSD